MSRERGEDQLRLSLFGLRSGFKATYGRELRIQELYAAVDDVLYKQQQEYLRRQFSGWTSQDLVAFQDVVRGELESHLDKLEKTSPVARVEQFVPVVIAGGAETDEPKKPLTNGKIGRRKKPSPERNDSEPSAPA